MAGWIVYERFDDPIYGTYEKQMFGRIYNTRTDAIKACIESVFGLTGSEYQECLFKQSLEQTGEAIKDDQFTYGVEEL